MATMIAEVYEALKEAGVSESKAIKAAEAIQQLSKGNHLHFVQEQMLKDQMYAKGEFKLLKWMIGFNLAFTMAML
ncbi:hypothetical protein [Methylomonas rosea]|uniref:Uncharacterized protein n=1 Tax=Methylomonas rosea TaxID=2952227 RepID=A0ABT1TWU6_9GAMM|nr:hypothetical protein [Methylomonas sp. WSC-7]MCQ8119010.1 hypothetical protein [Methylomonas sp. WSC-7]